MMSEETARPEGPAPESAVEETAPVVEEPAPVAEETPEAEAVAAEPEPEAAEEPPREKHRSKRRKAREGAIRRAREFADKSTAEPAAAAEPDTEQADVAEQPRDEQGRFAAKPKEEAPAEPAAEPEPEPTSEPAPEAPAVAEGFTRIELPEDHPLQKQGHTYLDVPTDQERLYRSLVADPVQRREVEAARHARERLATENETLRRQLFELKAQAEVTDPLQDPRIQSILTQVEERYSPEEAEILRASLEAKVRQEVTDRADTALRHTRLEAAGAAFGAEVQERAPSEFALWGNQLWNRLQPHLARYGRDVDAGTIAEPSVDDFFARVRAAYVRDPAVVAAAENYRKLRDQRIREEARKEERAEMERQRQEELRAAAERHATNPLGSVPRQETGVPSTAVPIAEQAKQSSKSRRRQAQQRARDRGRALDGR